MAGTITVDTIQSDSSYTSSINIASPVNFTSAPTMAGQAFTTGSRNVIINGGMRIAQRNNSTSVTITDATTNGTTNYYTVDRFMTGCRNASIVVVRDTDVPTGQGLTNSLKFTCNSASSNTTHNWVESWYGVENQDLLASGWVPSDPNSFITLSFWAKSSLAGTYVVQVRGTSKVISKYYTLAANTWTKVTMTIPGDASNSVANSTDGTIKIFFNIDTGTYYTDTSATSPTGSWFTVTSESNYYVDYPQRWSTVVGATFNFTGVQLEYGKVATPFEFRNYTTELLQCQRYYQKGFGYQGIQGTGSEISGTVYFVPKRISSSLSYTIIGGGPSSLQGFQHNVNDALYQSIQWWVNTSNKGSPGYLEFTYVSDAEIR